MEYSKCDVLQIFSVSLKDIQMLQFSNSYDNVYITQGTSLSDAASRNAELPQG